MNVTHARRTSRAFTLVELLVIIGIIGVLIGLLLPALSGVRRQARVTRCAANLSEICKGVHVYVSASKGWMPPNVYYPSPAVLWHDEDRIGEILGARRMGKGGVLACPNDPDGLRSYAMNVWASSRIDSWITKAVPALGQPWNGTAGSRTILMIESWSFTGNSDEGYGAPATVGYQGDTPGRRFGGGGGLIPLDAGRWGLVNSEVAYERHRAGNSPGRNREPVGAVNVGYADGHVELRTSDDLFDKTTGLSTLDSLWSPLDSAQNR